VAVTGLRDAVDYRYDLSDLLPEELASVEARVCCRSSRSSSGIPATSWASPSVWRPSQSRNEISC
jgi:hypothetical protein